MCLPLQTLTHEIKAEVDGVRRREDLRPEGGLQQGGGRPLLQFSRIDTSVLTMSKHSEGRRIRAARCPFDFFELGSCKYTL